MWLTIKTFPSSNKLSLASVLQLFGVVMLFVGSFCNIALAEAPNPKLFTKTPQEPNAKSFTTKTPAKITLHPEALELATTFVEKTLPNLIGDDPTLAEHLGFTTGELESLKEFGAALESPYPVFIISLRDIFEFVQHPSNPVDLIRKDVNWIRGPEGALIPARWLFAVELKENRGKSRVTPQTSVMVGKSPSSRWRVNQVGGPNLARAVKQWADSDTVSIIWIPALNRHYLGRVTQDGAVMLRVLFDDPLADVKAGKDFDPSDEKVINYLKSLEDRLKLRERLLTPNVSSPTAR